MAVYFYCKDPVTLNANCSSQGPVFPAARSCMLLLRAFKVIKSYWTTSLWAGCVATSVLTIAATGWYLGAGVIPTAFAAESSLSDFGGGQVDGLVSGNDDALDDLRRQIAETQAGLEQSAGFFRWAGRLSPALSWMPLLGHEVGALSDQVERARQDANASSDMLGAFAILMDVRRNAPAALTTPGAGPAIRRLKAQAEGARVTFARSRTLLSEREGSVSIFLQVPRVRTLSQRMAELESLMLLTARLGERLSAAMVDLMTAAEGVQPLLGQSDAGVEQPRTVASLEETLEQVRGHAVSARAETREAITLLQDSGQMESLLPQLERLGWMLDALVAVSEGATAGMAVLEPVLSSAEDTEGGLLRSGRLLDVFEAVEQRRDALDQAISRLEEAERIMQEGDAGNLSLMGEAVAELRTGLELVRGLAPVAGSILGEDGVRRYLVLGQTADELRATGGFVSSVWLVTVRDGGLEDIQYYDAVRVDDWDRLDLYPKAPPGLEEHMNGWVWLLRDVSWDPHFPTTARSAEDLFQLGQRIDVDGVVAINQWTLLWLMDALGEIPAPQGDKPITAGNLLSVLEEGTDAHGRAYMDLVLQGVLDSLGDSTSAPRMVELASALFDTLESRDTLVYMDDAEAQSVISDLGWDGGIRQVGSDYLMVVDSNVGWSKVDRNIQRGVSYTVDLSRYERPRSTLTLEYDNHSGPGSQPCEPQWRSRGSSYSQLKNACYWNFFRAYVPQESQFLSGTSLPLPTYSVSVETGHGTPGEDTMKVSSSHRKTVISGLAIVAAGEERSITMAYDLPPGVVRQEGNALLYELLVQKQPGVRHRQVSVAVILPEGYTLAESSMPPASGGDGRVRFAFDLTGDTVLSLRFRGGADASG